MKIDEIKSGFFGRELLGDWNGYKVFEVIVSDPDKESADITLTGYPIFILADKNGNERWDKGPDEAFEIMDFFDDEPDEEDDDFEN